MATMSETCTTRYPILMVHGMGARDWKHMSYWGRIPRVLREHGALVYFGGQDGNAAVETNALQLKSTVERVLEETGAEKVNIIAHSKGGLDARHMISSLGMADSVASLTTISTPHNGSETVDRLLRKTPAFLVKAAAFCTDVWLKLLGDRHPETYRVFHQLGTAFAKEFNTQNADMPQVYYQSYGFVMNGVLSDLAFLPPYLVVRATEGENDGLLSPRAVQWTNFRGVCRSADRRGISHWDEIDMRRRKLILNVEGKTADVPAFYQAIVEDLKSQGF